MTPAQPPFPTAWNLPFQPEAGNQTSILISESLVGFNVASTRQKEGRSLYPAFGFGPRPPGSVKAPASTACAKVIVVFGRASEVRLSQVAASPGAVSSKLSRTSKVDFCTSTAASSRSLAVIISQGSGVNRRKSRDDLSAKTRGLRPEAKSF